VSTVVAFASATDALNMVRAGLRFLATADATAMTAAEQAALADEAISRSYAREICRWTGSMPQEARAAADEILLAAAAGLELPDLAGLAAEM
jgi:hypothetical protein